MLIQITNPDAEPITVEQAKDYLRVDHDLDDERIAGMISQSRSVIENRTGIALVRCKYKWMPGANYIDRIIPRYPIVENENVDERGNVKSGVSSSFEFETDPGIIPEGLYAALYIYIEHLYDGAHKSDIEMFNSICSNFRINRGA